MKRPPKYLVVPCRTCGSSRRVVNGAYLRFRRERAWISLRELARRLAYSAAYLSDVETGKRAVTLMVSASYGVLVRDQGDK